MVLELQEVIRSCTRNNLLMVEFVSLEMFYSITL